MIYRSEWVHKGKERVCCVMLVICVPSLFAYSVYKDFYTFRMHPTKSIGMILSNTRSRNVKYAVCEFCLNTAVIFSIHGMWYYILVVIRFILQLLYIYLIPHYADQCLAILVLIDFKGHMISSGDRGQLSHGAS